MLKPLLKEPLIHFTLMAALLLWMHALIWPDDVERDQKLVRVDVQSLNDILRAQTGISDSARLGELLNSMPTEKRTDLIQRSFREEALYREALAMGLDQDDPAIRRRLIQRISLMADDIKPPTAADLDTLKEYFLVHAEKYAIDASITLTHVFVAGGENASIDRANELLQTLKRDQVSFEHSAQFGDRFLYHANYVNRTPEFIGIHFDQAFSQSVFSKDTQTEQWIGPIYSEHGAHLVYIAERSEARPALFEEVQGPVLQDYQRELQNQAKEENLAQIISDYELVVDLVDQGVLQTTISKPSTLSETSTLKQNSIESSQSK